MCRHMQGSATVEEAITGVSGSEMDTSEELLISSSTESGFGKEVGDTDAGQCIVWTGIVCSSLCTVEAFTLVDL